MTTWRQAISNSTHRVVASKTAKLSYSNVRDGTPASRACTAREDSASGGVLPSDTKCGFTFTELIVILLVIGILAAVATAKLTNMSVIQERSESDKVVSALQYSA
jgi:prepilin-type N-terminal cleavage/methylation domain-containing protein